MGSFQIDFPDPALAPDEIDLVAISAYDISGSALALNPELTWPKLTNFGTNWNPETLIAAYRRGLFPMPYEIAGRAPAIGWWSPQQRAFFSPDEIYLSTSLKASLKRFAVTVDKDFESVVRACGNPDRESGWISEEVILAFVKLYENGSAHSVEVWDRDGELVGGLYGLELGGVFAGESMFHTVADASKVALAHLGGLLNDGMGRIIDTQWQTQHLESMGAKTMSRREYCQILPSLLVIPEVFESHR